MGSAQTVFPHIARTSLRGERPSREVEALIGKEETNWLANVGHAPSAVSHRLAQLLQDAREQDKLDNFAFLQADKERALLIDHIGACERIAKTPLALAYCIEIRRFISLFLFALPLALLSTLGVDWHVPALTMLVAYPLFSLDQLGIELQNPFLTENLSHLPLDYISKNIENNVTDLLRLDD